MKKIVVLGAGESGVGAAVLAKKNGDEVFVSDNEVLKRPYREVLEKKHICFEEKKHTEARIMEADIVIKSPGIPDTSPLIQKLREKKKTIVSEVEFAARHTKAIFIGITGSNGKTTTAMLTYTMLKKEGLDTALAGNIGNSLAWEVAENTHESYVLELSSFQLDGIRTFKPHIAVITNIVPDHLDRYDQCFENYIASKFQIVKNQTQEDYLIYDADDSTIQQWLEKNTIPSKLMPFSIVKRLTQGAWWDGSQITVKINNETFIMNTKELTLQGKHNVKNIMASTLAARLMQVRKKTIRESLEDFEGVEHRLERVLKTQGITYVNDSKATNVNAAFYALDSMNTPVVWIMGGEDKGNDYTDLLPLVREKVKAIVCLGLDNEKIIETFARVVDKMLTTDSMKEAVSIAHGLSEEGDTVLLSPACASYDLFEDFKDRGSAFKEAVRDL